MFDFKANFSCVFVIIIAFVFEFNEQFFFVKVLSLKHEFCGSFHHEHCTKNDFFH